MDSNIGRPMAQKRSFEEAFTHNSQTEQSGTDRNTATGSPTPTFPSSQSSNNDTPTSSQEMLSQSTTSAIENVPSELGSSQESSQEQDSAKDLNVSIDSTKSEGGPESTSISPKGSPSKESPSKREKSVERQDSKAKDKEAEAKSKREKQEEERQKMQ